MQQLAAGGARVQSRRSGSPVFADDFGNREAVLRVANGGLQQCGQRHRAVSTCQGLPAAHRAGDGHRKRTLVRDLGEAHSGQELYRRPLGRSATGVERLDALLIRHTDQSEQVSADSRGVGLHDIQRRGGRHRGIDGIASFDEHPQTCHRRPVAAWSPPSRW